MLVAAGFGQAMETMAYRFAEQPQGLFPGPDSPVVANAPEPSPFCGPGDEIQDLTKLLRDRKIPLADGWAVWNKTRRLLVIRGSMADQWQVEEFSDFRKQTRLAKLTVEWLRGDDNAPPPATSAPAWAAVTTVGRSGTKASGSVKFTDRDGPWSFSVETDPIFSETDKVIDFRMAAEWSGSPGGIPQHGDLVAGLSMQSERTIPVA